MLYRYWRVNMVYTNLPCHEKDSPKLLVEHPNLTNSRFDEDINKIKKIDLGDFGFRPEVKIQNLRVKNNKKIRKISSDIYLSFLYFEPCRN